jgi:hypothetical protein
VLSQKVDWTTLLCTQRLFLLKKCRLKEVHSLTSNYSVITLKNKKTNILNLPTVIPMSLSKIIRLSKRKKTSSENQTWLIMTRTGFALTTLKRRVL